jgi:glycolate oxidase iron-sulfur subunit
MVEMPGAGCCGAVRFHLDDADGARADARRNIDAWWPDIEAGRIEAIVMTASGCGVQVRDYGHLLQHDPVYAERAQRVSELTRDIAEVVLAEGEALQARLAARAQPREALAWHAPCTLQHGQRIRGTVESLLLAAGFDLTPVRDAHLCCGSAGTYSILQPELSGRLRANKLDALLEGGAGRIASANIGCMTHLQAGTDKPVLHWIELIDARLRSAS